MDQRAIEGGLACCVKRFREESAIGHASIASHYPIFLENGLRDESLAKIGI